MRLILFVIVSVFVGAWLLAGCQKLKYEDPTAESRAREEQILTDFYNGPLFDSIIQLGVDTIDRRDTAKKLYGYVVVIREQGLEDQISLSNQVGYYYTSYEIAQLKDVTKDESLKNRTDPVLVYANNNVGAFNPAISNSSSPYGIYYGLSHMKKYGSCTIIMSGTYAGTSYYPMVYDMDIVYVR